MTNVVDRTWIASPAPQVHLLDESDPDLNVECRRVSRLLAEHFPTGMVEEPGALERSVRARVGRSVLVATWPQLISDLVRQHPKWGGFPTDWQIAEEPSDDAWFQAGNNPILGLLDIELRDPEEVGHRLGVVWYIVLYRTIRHLAIERDRAIRVYRPALRKALFSAASKYLRDLEENCDGLVAEMCLNTLERRRVVRTGGPDDLPEKGRNEARNGLVARVRAQRAMADEAGFFGAQLVPVHYLMPFTGDRPWERHAEPAAHEDVPLFYAPRNGVMMEPAEIRRAIYRSYVAIYDGDARWQSYVDELEHESAALDGRSRPWWAEVWI